MTHIDTQKPAADAAMSPTGADIDNDHADERPVDRSQDSPDSKPGENGGNDNPDQTGTDGTEEDGSGMLGEGGMEAGDLDEHGNPRRGEDKHNIPVE